MKCLISGTNATILAKAIQSFARIGSEIFFEGTENGLNLSTVNASKSAFAIIKFSQDFFVSFSVKQSNSNDFENQCKLTIKSCLGAFRNMKHVQSCSISLDTEACKLIVHFKCRLETTKTHQLSILAQESMEAIYLTDNVPNVLVGDHKLFNVIVSNFKANEEELSLQATQKDIVARNYVEGTKVDPRFVRSQLTLQPEEFQSYKIDENTCITFRMRSLRAILTFAESMSLTLAAHFETAGKPVAFVIKDCEMFEVNLVMSTLTPDDEDELRSELEEISKSNTNNNQSHTDSISIDTTSTRRKKSSAKRNREHSTESNANESCHSNDVIRRKRKTTNINNRRESAENVVDGPESDQISHIMPPPIINKEILSEDVEVVFQEDSEEINVPIDNDISFVFNKPRRSGRTKPPPRDHRPIIQHVFQRCFASQSQSSESLGQVLAECSDDE